MDVKMLALLVLLFLFPIALAINPFEGGFVRQKCLKGIVPTGCNRTLLEYYKSTNLSVSDENIAEADTYIMLFTRNNTENPEYLDECGGTLPTNTYFNPKWDVEIFIHGYFESVCEVAWMREMVYQLLCRGDYNIILVDYGWGNQLDYYDSVRNGKIVGKQLALVIKAIVEKTGISPAKIHIIGHSLGAHVAGIAGYYVQQLLGTKVRRITGLDPAGPGFQNTSLENKLDKSDAAFVDNIHTNAGPCLPLNFGLKEALAHIDFYPNGGSQQLSCMPYTIDSFLKQDFSYAILSLLPPMCYHKQSVQFYKVSINPCPYQCIGVQCNSSAEFDERKCTSCGTDGSNCAVMGMDAEYFPWKEGKYYLNTSMNCPYCDNKSIDRAGFPLWPPGKEKPRCFPKECYPLWNIG